MISRYSVPEIVSIWNDQNKFKTFLEVEIKTLEAWQLEGIIPSEDLEKIKTNASFNLDRIYEIEKQTHHDVIAFTRAVSETLGEEKKWVHYGLTSTDVVDTANGVLLKQSNVFIKQAVEELLAVLKRRALEFKATPCIGRTHGIHADITSFGLKWALWYDELKRNYERFLLAAAQVEVGKISGAVGNFVNTKPQIQDYVCKALEIGSVSISTQVLQRDRHANYLFNIALIASSIEKIALEVRSLQRTEINEVQEYFAKTQKGSSAMPHKRNPIASENVTGIARVLKSYVAPALDDIPLWHERDISHSSVERIILPDAINLIVYMVRRYTKTLDKLLVHPKNMETNIFKTNGVVFSQRVLTYLIKEKGLSREQSYDLVQTLAFESWNQQLPFKEVLKSSKDLQSYLSSSEIDSLFDLDYFMQNVDAIFERVFK